jgi:hypothetical protein
MYCSACGTEIQPGLSYCSRCGKRAAEAWNQTGQPRSPLVVAGNIAGVGFVAFIFVLLVLVLNGVVGSNIVGVTFFYFLALFLVCFMFLRQSRYYASQENRDMKSAESLYMKPVTTAQLPEPTERPASVTEHTTRTLDHVPVERH